ncbi:UbiH/UbiF/VisC/COQ6 family ubiquinone biosynthesis hydroxylase [Acetobacteraceae bacterium H6797]|nr:UbiH/UbiF/VisC/COQ6 family ubiquinone biosynthesis hydroxylase [Acetobacteraceae bacterium H6797]
MSDVIEVAVCILGAGPVGGSLAASLASEGVSTLVVDSAPLPPMERPEFDGRAYAIAAASRDTLTRAGLWDLLPGEANPIRHIRVEDGRPGEPASPLTLDFDAEEAGTGPFGFMVEARDLRIALNRRLEALESLTLRAPDKALSIERSEEGVTLRLASGATVKARLLVAAEGRQSPARREAGIGTARFDYRRVGMVGAIAHELPHGDGALEKFLPAGPFAQLPMAPLPEHPHVSAIVWAEKPELAEAALKLSDEAYGREIERRMGSHLGRVTPIGRRWSYPLTAMQAMRYAGTRLAIVGDAAHGMHPIAGQGLNIGFRDVAALRDLVLDAMAEGRDPGSPEVLAAYQAKRRPDALAMIAATHALERLFGNDIAPIRWARRLGIAAVDRLPGLKRAFVRQAMGI